MTIIVDVAEITGASPYRTKYRILATNTMWYNVTLLHRQSKIHPAIAEGDMLVIYQDRHTGAKWMLKSV